MDWKSLVIGGVLAYCLSSIVLKEVVLAVLPLVSSGIASVMSTAVFLWVLGAGPALAGYLAARRAANAPRIHAACAGMLGAGLYLALYWQDISPAWLAWGLAPWAAALAVTGERLARITAGKTPLR